MDRVAVSGGEADEWSVSPADLREIVAASMTTEFATVRDGRPATVPVTPLYDRERDAVVVTSPPAFAGKADRAAANPAVGMLLHGPDGPVHLTGTATVREGDLEANAARVEQLIRDEPPSRKRSAMLGSASFLDTRLGRLLLDWYGLRILIEVDPDSVRRVDPPAVTGVDRWPAAGVERSEATRYDRAVATVVAGDGRPLTWPLGRAAFADGELRLTPPPDVSPADGDPACVLCHWFGPDLQELGQRLVRGRVRHHEGGFGFDPASSFRLRNESMLDLLRFVVDGKRRTRRYYEERGGTYRFLTGVQTPPGGAHDDGPTG